MATILHAIVTFSLSSIRERAHHSWALTLMLAPGTRVGCAACGLGCGPRDLASVSSPVQYRVRRSFWAFCKCHNGDLSCGVSGAARSRRLKTTVRDA